MTDVQWILVLGIWVAAVGLLGLAVHIWRDSKFLGLATLVVGLFVLFIATIVAPNEFQDTNRRKELCNQQGDYWYDPPRAKGICLDREMVKG